MVTGHTRSSWRAPITVPQAETLKSGRGAAQRVQEGRHPGRHGGAGRRGRAGADGRHRWPAPIIKPLLGKAVVPDDSPFTTGGHRPAGHAPLRAGDGGVRRAADGRHHLPLPQVVSQARTRPRPCRSTSTRPGSACAIRSSVGLVGDARATLQALLPLLQPKKDRSFLEKAQEGMKEWWELMRDPRDARRHAGQAAGRRAARQRPAQATTRSSRPTRARSPPGRRGTSTSAGG